MTCHYVFELAGTVSLSLINEQFNFFFYRNFCTLILTSILGFALLQQWSVCQFKEQTTIEEGQYLKRFFLLKFWHFKQFLIFHISNQIPHSHQTFQFKFPFNQAHTHKHTIVSNGIAFVNALSILGLKCRDLVKIKANDKDWLNSSCVYLV